MSHPELKYAGTIDWIGVWQSGSPDEWWIIDFTTSTRMKKWEQLSRKRLQLAAYRLAIAAMTGIEIHKAAIPVILPGRPAHIFELEPEEMAEDETGWLERLEQFQEDNP